MGEWKRVDLTTYPFCLKDEMMVLQGEVPQDTKAIGENQILQDIFSAELGGRDLEYFDAETESPPSIPDELKAYCPKEDQNTKWWPNEIGNTVKLPHDWRTWFYLDHYAAHHTTVRGLRNRRLDNSWYLVRFDGLSPIIIRPVPARSS